MLPLLLKSTSALVVNGAAPVTPQRAAARMVASGPPPEPPSVSARVARLQLPFGVAAGYALNAVVRQNTRDFPGADVVREAARRTIVDAPAEAAMERFFPGSLGSSAVDHQVWRTLQKKGYTKANTLFATSTCPDEVNSKPDELIDLMKDRWGENFSLGGLGGVPFTGKAGFAAYAHHVPDKGKMFIMFAPHVGVEYDGKVGALRRMNQDGTSTACGAAIGAYNGIVKEATQRRKLGAETGVEELAYGVTDGVSDYFDAQINFIKLKLGSRLNGIDDANDPIAYVSYQMYLLVREFFINEVITAPGFWDYGDELCVLGGIMVNRGTGGDRLLPLMFQTRTQAQGSCTDLYSETFGAEPDLSAILGSEVATSFYKYDLETFKLSDKRQSILS